jgi:hypothetical protein
VFSIDWEHPHATLPQENTLVWEPPLQQKILLTSRQEHPNPTFNEKSVFHYVGERFSVQFFFGFRVSILPLRGIFGTTLDQSPHLVV